jgi:hypothetical protein
LLHGENFNRRVSERNYNFAFNLQFEYFRDFYDIHNRREDLNTKEKRDFDDCKALIAIILDEFFLPNENLDENIRYNASQLYSQITNQLPAEAVAEVIEIIDIDNLTADFLTESEMEEYEREQMGKEDKKEGGGAGATTQPEPFDTLYPRVLARIKKLKSPLTRTKQQQLDRDIRRLFRNRNASNLERLQILLYYALNNQYLQPIKHTLLLCKRVLEDEINIEERLTMPDIYDNRDIIENLQEDELTPRYDDTEIRGRGRYHYNFRKKMSIRGKEMAQYAY